MHEGYLKSRAFAILLLLALVLGGCRSILSLFDTELDETPALTAVPLPSDEPANYTPVATSPPEPTANVPKSPL